ncbi:MAG TPA: spherulation-specific family 4 protein [Candidatus Nitrosotalea sp.]|nr:spherulation-specific family 4 protein [Candidatus Nitrosotalea sp.]
MDESGLMVPLYSYPGNTWDKLIQEKTLYHDVPVVAIINPDNGPGVKDGNYVAGIQKLQKAGIVVLGYVYTKNVDTTEIRNDINEYKNWYGVDGVFFDAMSNTHGDETFYKQISDYAKSMGLTYTVGNPGADTIPSYIGTVDNLVIHDNSGFPASSLLDGWHANFTKSHFSSISYGVSHMNKTYVAGVIKHVKYLYVTDLTLPNPFNGLPSYIDDLMAMVNSEQNNKIQLRVLAYGEDNNTINGLWTTAKSGTNVTSGFTPFVFNADGGTYYTVTVANYGNLTFDHWEDGSTNNTRIVLPDQNMTLEAFYRMGQTVNQTISHSGNQTVLKANVHQSGLAPLENLTTSVTSENQTAKQQLTNESSQVSTLPEEKNLGSIDATIMYAGGDRADYSLLSFKIFQDSSRTLYRQIDSVTSNPFYINELPIGHKYKVQVIANGMVSDIEYVDLGKNTAQLSLYLPFPGGMRLHIFYNDGYTPISNAIVVVKSSDNKTWATSNTDKNGETLRFWLEPTTMKNDFFVTDIQIGRHLSYSYSPVFLYPGRAQEINVITPWPPTVERAITVKLYDMQSKLYSPRDGPALVGLFDDSNKLVAEAKVTPRGDAEFANLTVGDFVIRAINGTDGSIMGESEITVDGGSANFNLYENRPIANNQTGTLMTG